MLQNARESLKMQGNPSKCKAIFAVKAIPQPIEDSGVEGLFHENYLSVENNSMRDLFEGKGLIRSWGLI